MSGWICLNKQEPGTGTSTQLVPIGINLELVDDDDNGLENTTVTHHPEPQSGTNNHRYPQREWWPPMKYDDFVSH